MDEQLKNRLPEQCLFTNAAGEIMSIEYGKSGFRRSDLSAENRKANREIVNSYNERHGITAEQVKMMRNGTLFGWDTLHEPYPSRRQESSVKDSSIFEIEVSRPGAFGTDTAVEVSLPATPYELVDALDKARVIDERVIYSTEIIDCKLDKLPLFISYSINLYELNHLAQRLSVLNEWEMDCFEGMIRMDAKEIDYSPIAVERLINMTHSTEGCQVVHEASDDESLGRFYAEYGFVPELETLPERIFPWLDYGKIGKEMREGEGGVFTPNGYVVQNGEIAEVYQSGAAIPLDKPDYAVLLRVMKGCFNEPEHNNDPVTFLKLPAADEELHQAIEEVDAATPEECAFTTVDCIIPWLTEKIADHLYETDGDCYGMVNELAGQLQRLNREGKIPTCKAMLEAAPKDISLEEALDLAYQTDRFTLLRETTSVVDYAAKEIQRIMSYESEKGLEKYFDLPGYGRFLMEKNGVSETAYGLLAPRDGQTVEQCLSRPEHHIKLELEVTIKVNDKNLQAAYIERLNAILPTVDFAKLDRSCNSSNGEYAKEILKQMHDLFVEVYRTDNLDSGYEFVEVPAVIRGQKTGHIGLGIVTLDLQSSGEHWGTFFLTPQGVIDQGFEKMKPADSKYLSAVYIPYDYWYTVSIERDHHVDFDHVPEKVAELLNSCYPDQPEQGQCSDEPGQNLEMK